LLVIYLFEVICIFTAKDIINYHQIGISINGKKRTNYKTFNHLRILLSNERDLLLKMEDKNIPDIQHAEVEINIRYYNQEIEEIEDLLKELEKNIS